MTIQVSVVVPTFKRPELLQRCLSALLAQDFDPTAYEVIVVDDAACAETKRVVESWIGHIESSQKTSGCVAMPGSGGIGQTTASTNFSNGRIETKKGQPDEAGQARLEFMGEAIGYTEGLPLHGYKEPTLERGSSVQIQRAPEPLIVRSTPRPDQSKHLRPNGSNGARRTPLLRYMTSTEAHGPAAARNCGWRAAKGQIIAFTDDDCIPKPGWLSAGVAAFVDGVVGVGGWVSVPLPDTPTDYERTVAGLEGIQFITANCFYRREALAAIGGFDECFTAAWREDSDLFFSLLEYYDGDSRLVHEPNAIVVHPIRPAPWGVSLSQQRKSMFNALLYKKHPALYRELIQPAPAWRYYWIVGSLLVAGGSMIGGYPWLALAAAGVWLFLTGHFCGQRLYRTSHASRHIAEMVVTSALIPPLALFWRSWGAFKFRVLFL